MTYNWLIKCLLISKFLGDEDAGNGYFYAWKSGHLIPVSILGVPEAMDNRFWVKNGETSWHLFGFLEPYLIFHKYKKGEHLLTIMLFQTYFWNNMEHNGSTSHMIWETVEVSDNK